MSRTRRYLVRLVGTALPPWEVEIEVDEDEAADDDCRPDCPACVAVAGVTRAPDVEFGGAFGVGATPVSVAEDAGGVTLPDGPEEFYLTTRIDPFAGVVGISCVRAPGENQDEREHACADANAWIRAEIEDGGMVSGAAAEAARASDGTDAAWAAEDAARMRRPLAPGEFVEAGLGPSVLGDLVEMVFSPATWAARYGAEVARKMAEKRAAEKAGPRADHVGASSPTTAEDRRDEEWPADESPRDAGTGTRDDGKS